MSLCLWLCDLCWIGGTFNRCFPHSPVPEDEECGITQEPFDLWSSYPGLLLRIVIEVFRCLETQDEFILRMDYVRRVLESI